MRCFLRVLRSPGLICSLALLLGGLPARAEVKLPHLISHNMVLQQGRKAAIWGWADPQESVQVSFRGQKVTTTTGADGRWKVYLQPLKAGGPDELIISGKNTITIRNVLVGEVWVCSGQSNMEMPLAKTQPWYTGIANFEAEIESAYHSQLRMFTVKTTVASRPQEDAEGQWMESSPATAGSFSAVGYFFGRELLNRLGVPVGIIHSSSGGTPAEAWQSRATLESDPDLKLTVDRRDREVAAYPAQVEKYEKEFGGWKEAARQAEADGKAVPPPPTLPPDPRTVTWRPTGLYNAMLLPLTQYAIQGAIWYQGEAHSGAGLQYRKLLPGLIRDWRGAWGQGDFPFLYVQLANFWTLPVLPAAYPYKGQWVLIREAQLMTLSMPKTGMAVAIDIGERNDVHPKNKQEVGRRLALAAEAIAYGRDVVYSGPIYTGMDSEGDKVRVRFKHVDGGLVAKGSDELKGFEIAGEDRKFVEAEAKIDGDTILVTSKSVPHPVAVRYAWAMDPVCNLYNESGLPASPFRTDDWPMVFPLDIQ